MSVDTPLFCLKMRASETVDNKPVHISGAEKIVTEKELMSYTNSLIERGLHHAKGNADFINLKVEKINSEDVIYLDALDVTTVEVDTWQDGISEVYKFLNDLKISNPDGILEILKETYAMRGAMLLDVNTLERLEPDLNRGIRATYMDRDRSENNSKAFEKDHFLEAIVLATKVINCPGIIGEICISDDPDYVTGYVSSKIHGYRRITKMKEMGSPNGGRIFLYNGDSQNIDEAISFLQNEKVIVRGVKPLNAPQKTNPMDRLSSAVENMRANNLYRTMKTIESSQGSHITMDGKDYLLMASNSYLDITKHPRMVEATINALKEYGAGSGGSRLTTGNTDLHDALEKKIADFKKRDKAIVFNTGYVANLAAISALMKDGGIIFSDELNHASIIDGCRLSRAKCVVYKHNDMLDLRNKIKANPCDFGLVVSDAVFSMDGDILNLPEFVNICRENNLLSMVDEAHSTGVIGKTGHGIEEHYNYTSKPDILMGTLSKSVGGEGGYIASNETVIDYLRNFARGFIFSTSLAPSTIASDIEGLSIIEDEPELVSKLQSNVKFFCNALKENGLDITSDTAIIPIVIGDEEKAINVSKNLMDNGIFISAIRYPTVAKGQARLRVALMASHTEDELKRAAKLISELVL